MSKTLIEIDAFRAEFEALETHGHIACDTLKAAGVLYPLRPHNSTGRALGDLHIREVVANLRSYVGELQALAAKLPERAASEKPSIAAASESVCSTTPPVTPSTPGAATPSAASNTAPKPITIDQRVATARAETRAKKQRAGEIAAGLLVQVRNGALSIDEAIKQAKESK
jgi:hypothetical protein